VTKSEVGFETLELNFAVVTEVKPTFRVNRAELASLATMVLEAEEAHGPWEVTVALVDDARLQGLHRQFMGIDEPTDIMTFPATADNSGVQGGELVISVDHARTQAGAWGHTPSDEVRFLVVHGVLHLLGWRDEIDDDRQRMLERQQVLFERWKADKRAAL
jgi:probable rRNA maturation factor